MKVKRIQAERTASTKAKSAQHRNILALVQTLKRIQEAAIFKTKLESQEKG